MWREFWQFIGGSIVLLGAITYLSKIFITQLFSKDLERFKSDLILEKNKEQFRFERLHYERATVINDIYQRLTDVIIEIEYYVKYFKFHNESADSLVAEVQGLSRDFERSKLFFGQTLAKQISKLISDLDLVIEYFGGWFGQVEKDHKYKELLDECLEVRTGIESEFRKIIGVI